MVVAIDGGAASDSAIDWAIDRAAVIGAHLEILTIVDVHWTRPSGADPGLAAHERVVFEAGQRVAASGICPHWSTTVHHDRVVPGLVAATRRAELVVMGSHKPVHAVGSIHGTLPLVVAARAVSPIVVVPAGWTRNAGPVVIGVDDRSGTAAMHFAAAEADRAHTTLVAVRAYDVPPIVARAWGTADEPLRRAESLQLIMLDSMLSAVRRDRGQLEIAATVARGRPALVLAEHAKDASLTVVGRHASDGTAQARLGPVAHDLLMNLPSPVAVVPERSTPPRRRAL
ncbi:universal stress protein [Agrococcus citreus]|uniref:universal stress protein n=1 Tax=Agrococcus citreus TaxID=84643 RepID=UPI0031D3045E